MGIFRNFPYSNFHEMNTDEIIKIVKSMLEEWEEYNSKWNVLYDDISTAFEAFKAEFDNFIASIDVDAEFDQALDRLISSGEFANVVDPIVSSHTSEWLAEHISATEGETVIDTSLTVAGAAADAKATGTHIRNLKNDVHTIPAEYIEYNIIHDVTFNSRTKEGFNITSLPFEGFHISGANETANVIDIILTNSFILKKNTRYKLYEKEPGIISRDTYHLDIRPNSDVSSIITYENNEKGSTFYTGNEDIEVVLTIRIAPYYSMDKTIIPYLYEYSEKNTPITIHKTVGFNRITPASFSNDIISSHGVTARNNKDGTLTINGTADATTALSLIMIHHKITLIGGHSYIFGSNSNMNTPPSIHSYRLDLRDANDLSVVKAYEESFGGFIHVNETAEYAVSIRINNGFNMDGCIITPYICDISEMNNAKSILKLCTYNVGNFNNGVTPTPAGTAEMFTSFLNVFTHLNADIYAFTEWDEFWNTEEAVLSEDKFKNFKPYSTIRYDKTTGRFTASMTYSNFPLFSENYSFFGDGQSRSFTDNTVIIGDKLIHIINTHLPWSSQELRRTDIDKIFEYIEEKNIEYFIIAGDFNLGLGSDQSIRDTAIEDINYIENKNVNSVQGGFWGGTDIDNLINTFNNPEEDMCPYDNIVTSKNISIINAYSIESNASDHYPLYAELLILDNNNA